MNLETKLCPRLTGLLQTLYSQTVGIGLYSTRETTKGYSPTQRICKTIYRHQLKPLSILINELFYPLVIILQPKTLKRPALRREIPLHSFDLI